MESVSNMVQGTIPNYLQGLPIPKTLLGWFSLGVTDWMRILPFGIYNLAAVGGLTYLTLHGLSNAPGIGPVVKVRENLEFTFQNLQSAIKSLFSCENGHFE